MSYLTRKYEAKTKPWFSQLLPDPAKNRSGSISGIYTHLRTYLLAPDPHGAANRLGSIEHCVRGIDKNFHFCITSIAHG